MPQNPNLFPSDYPDLCPKTDAPEDDGLDEILRMLIALRHQHLLAARRHGQSIAELQNQSLIVLDCCVPTPINPPPDPPPPVDPPPINRKIFFGGGEFHGVHGQVDKFLPDALQVTTMGWEFTTARMRHAAMSGHLRGYWLGGQSNSGGLSSIEAINFAPETKASIATALLSNRVYARAANSETKGYNVGHDSGTTKVFDIFNLIAETMSSGGVMPFVSGGCNAGQSLSKAYFCAGIAQTERDFDTIAFSNDATAHLAALLTVARRRGVGISSESKFYIGGGVSSGAGYQNSFEAMSFSNDSNALIGATLAVATDDIEGMGLGLYGVIIEGFNQTPAHKMQKLTFSSERCEEIAAVLNRGGRYSSPTGKV